ncbi:MAG: BlaI/MecI/CopY family transcriptional regulator [Verrucomicrobiota bacterium]
MNYKVQISDAEWAIMKVIWKLEKATANEVIQRLAKERKWKPQTIQTLIRRLLNKGVLANKKRGREFVFYPALCEEECAYREARSFLDRVFDGELAPFVSTFISQENLSKKEISELKRILEDQSNQ